MALNTKHLLPAVIDPGELVCLQVYIPKDDLYLQAFSEVYEKLGTWQVWERDGTTRASQAAQVWKDAIDISRQIGWIGACMTPECCQAIVDAINGISLTVNVESGGGGCCGTDKTWKLPDGFEDGLPTSYPVPSTEDTVLIDQDLCDQAHQTWAKIREFFDNFADLTDELQPYDELLAFVVGLGIFVLPPAAGMITLLTLGAGAVYAMLERDTLDFWDQMKNDFVCAMVNHDNADAFYSWLVDYVNTNAPNIFVKQWMLAVLQMPDWTLIYDGEFDIEPEFENSDCSNCIQVNPFPGAPEGYAIVFPVAGQVSFNNINNGTGLFNGFDMGYEALSGEWNGSYAKFNTEEIRDSVAGIRIDGWMFYIIDANGTDEIYDQFDIASGDMPLLPADIDTTKIYYNNTYAVDLSAFITQFDDSTPYGSAPVAIGDEVQLYQAISRYSPKEYIYKIAFLVKL